MKKRLLALAGTIVAVFLIVSISAATGPDETLMFSRSVPSKASAEILARHLSDITQWPKWFYATTDVKLSKKATLETGAELTFSVEPKKNKRFEIHAEVTDYVPGERITMQVVSESTGKLHRLFDQLSWTIEIIHTDKGMAIRGTETARTAHWKTRLFGKIATRILMHQLFYPDLIKLAEITRPSDAQGPRSILAPPEAPPESAYSAIRSVLSNRSR